MNPTPSKNIESICHEQHIQWLAKAETAKINGNELTVLPYGYLQQAIAVALSALITTAREQLARKQQLMETDHVLHKAFIDGYVTALNEADAVLEALLTDD